VSSCDGDCPSNVMTAQQVQNQLAKGNFVISTDNSQNQEGQHGDIFVQASINWGTDNSLTLNAYRDINIYSPFSYDPVTIANTRGGNLALRADKTGTGVGTVNFQNPNYYLPAGRVDYSGSTGTVSIFYNPAGELSTKYQTPRDFSCTGSCST